MIKIARVMMLATLLVAAPAARAADDDAAAFVSQMVSAAKATEVSGLVVVAKPNATPLSGVDVVAKRKAPPLSSVEVDDPARCLPPRKPADQDVPAPRLVSTYPANGQTVEPGYVVLRLTFDLPMACRGSVGKDLLGPCAASAAGDPLAQVLDDGQIWYESYDRRTLLILCKLAPKTRYEMPFNQNKTWEHFVVLGGREPPAGRFVFETSDAPPVMTVAGLVERDPQLAAVVKR